HGRRGLPPPARRRPERARLLTTTTSLADGPRRPPRADADPAARGGRLYLLLGDAMEAIALLAMIVLVVVITVVQERRTEKAVDALRDLSSPRALVVRDGRRKRIPGRDVVRGDLVV